MRFQQRRRSERVAQNHDGQQFDADIQRFRHRKLQRFRHYELVRRNRGRIVILHDKYPQHKVLLLEIVRQRARYGGRRQRRLLQNRKLGFSGGNK